MNVHARLLPLAAALLVALPAVSQNYPTRPVRVIVPFAAGGNTDITARAIGAKLSEVFGQQIVVENRPGGATNIGSELVAKAPPDGYTILMGGATNAINMSTQAKPPYDTLRDFAPVILCVKGANVLTIHPSLPAKNLKELIALARARPGQLNFASSGLGSSNQMAGELFKFMANVNIVHVPYKGNAPALTDTLAGNVEMMFSGVPVIIPHIQSGRLRAIAHRQPQALHRDSRGADLRRVGAEGLRGDHLVRPHGAGEDAEGDRRAVERGGRQDPRQRRPENPLPQRRPRADGRNAGGVRPVHPRRDRKVREAGEGFGHETAITSGGTA